VTGILIDLMAALIVFGFFKLRKDNQLRTVQQQDLWGTVPNDARANLGLLVFRVLSCLYHLSVHVSLLVLNDEKWSLYRFFTIWSYTVLIIYFGVGSCWSLKGSLFCLLGELLIFSGYLHYRKSGTWEDTKTVGPFGLVFIVLFELNCTMVLLVDTVLWGILFPWAAKDGMDLSIFLNFWSYNQHGTNFLFMLVEFAFATVPFFPADVLFILLWTLTYIITIWIVRAVNDSFQWPYPFLDTTTWLAPAWYLGLGLLHAGYYFLVFGLYKLKLKYTVLGERLEDRDLQESDDNVLNTDVN